MGKNRLFIPQETMDQWVDDARAVVQDNELCLADDGKVYHLAPAVLFLREATGADDPNDLVGRVKEEAQLTILGADAYMDSVILDDNAYDVRRGFVAVPAIAPVAKETLPPPAVATLGTADAVPSAELSSPPDIIDDPPQASAPLLVDVSGDDFVDDSMESSSPETIEERDDESDTDGEGIDAELDDDEIAAVDSLGDPSPELEDLSHELEDITEEEPPKEVPMPRIALPPPRGPARSEPRSPAKSAPTSLAKSAPTSPAKGELGSPAKSAPKSPAKSAPKSPAKSAPKSPAKGDLRSPVKSPAKNAPKTPPEGEEEDDVLAKLLLKSLK